MAVAARAVQQPRYDFAALSTNVETPAPVRCSECGKSFPVSARSRRRYRAGRSRPVCPDCRGVKPAPAAPLEPPDEELERQQYRDWWLERFTLDELRELGREIWPELVGERRARPSAARAADTPAPASP